MPWINFPKVEGLASYQAHVNLPEGTFERELGKEGFYGPATQMYHLHPPTAWTDIKGQLRPRAFDTQKLISNDVFSTIVLFSNDTVQISFVQLTNNMDHLRRNADGDELLFVHQGSGELFCDYGHLSFSEGDYLLLPRGTLWRISTEQPICLLIIEATNESFQLPEKGIVSHQALFDPAILATPKVDTTFIEQQNENEWQVIVKSRNQFSTLTYSFNPLDAVGWHGTLMPVRVNWRDIRPLMSHSYHLPPSAHTTFTSRYFVVCTFVPRPSESDPESLNLPFFHSNDDYDELIFYHHGRFFSRDHIYPGMMTLHPRGIPHGPHPKALQLAKNRKPGRMMDEVAVMIDTRNALDISLPAQGIEWSDYVDSWK